MPFLAAIPAAIAGAAAAVGGAISAGVAAVGGLAAVSTGLTLVGTAVSVIGMATGNKTMQKVGLGSTAAGGVGGLANAFRAPLSAATSALSPGKIASTLSRNPSATTGVLDDLTKGGVGRSSSATKLFADDNLAGNIAAANKTNGLPAPAGLLRGGDPMTPGAQIMSSVQPDVLGKNLGDSAKDQIAKYDRTANILGGMGEAYLMNRRLNVYEGNLNLNRNQVAFDQGQTGLTRQNVNSVASLNMDVVPNNTGLLRQPSALH